ncbi:MAG: competence protein F [Betaproteobacteria bacterium]
MIPDGTRLVKPAPRLLAGLGRALKRAFGQDCFLCGQPTQAPVCPGCARDLPAAPANACPICALATPDGSTCGRCLARAPAFDATQSAFSYAYPVDGLIQAGKYHAAFPVLSWLAQYLSARCLAHYRDSGSNPDLIVPMPLHAVRLRERGYNQATLLALPLAARWQVPLADTLVTRLFDTAPQSRLSLPARRRNLRGAFACSTDLSGRHVVVIDDVMTSGTSLDELAMSLKRCGAARVDNWVLARTPALPSGR